MKIQTQIFLLTLSNGEKAVPPKDPLVRLEQLKSHSTKLMADFFSSCSGHYLIFNNHYNNYRFFMTLSILSVCGQCLIITHEQYSIFSRDDYKPSLNRHCAVHLDIH